MLVTLAGMVISVNAVPMNAPAPMLVKLELESNVTVAKLVAFLNASRSMLITLAGMIMEVNSEL